MIAPVPRRTFIAFLAALPGLRLRSEMKKSREYQPSFLHPNDRWVVLRSDKNFQFELMDLETGKSICLLEHSDYDSYYGSPRFFFNPSGRFLVMLSSAYEGGVLKCWNLDSGGPPIQLAVEALEKDEPATAKVGSSGEFPPPFALPGSGDILRFSDNDRALQSFRLIRRRKTPFQGPFLEGWTKTVRVECRNGHSWESGAAEGPFEHLKSGVKGVPIFRMAKMPMCWYPEEAMGGGDYCIPAHRRTADSILVWSGYSTVREVQCTTGKVLRCISGAMPQTGLLAFGKSRNEVYASRPLDMAVKWNRLGQATIVKEQGIGDVQKPPIQEMGPPLQNESAIAFERGTRSLTWLDGNLAIGRDDGRILLGKTASKHGSPWESLGKHESAVRALAFAPENPWLLSGARDGTLRLWDLQTLRLSKDLQGHEARVNAASIGLRSIAATAGPDGIRLWDLKSGNQIRHIETGGVWVSDICFSPDGKTVAAALLDGSLGLWDMATGSLKWQAQADEGWCATLAFHPQGQYIAAGYELGAVILWGTANGRRVRKARVDGQITWQGGCRSVHAVGWSPDGEALAVGFGDAVKIYDRQLQSGKGPGWLLPLDWGDYYT